MPPSIPDFKTDEQLEAFLDQDLSPYIMRDFPRMQYTFDTSSQRQTPVYQTERLALYPMTKRFREPLTQLHQNPQVMTYIGPPYSQEKTDQKVHANEQHWLDHGFGLWCALHKQTGDLVGRGGLRYQTLDQGETITELAYMISPNFWKQGYASELTTYAIATGFET